jgi:cytochrome c peroxidase
MRRTSSDPGRVLLTGFVAGPAPLDDWQKFDVNGLRGIRKTAPYFHNNSAATLEEVVDHYIAFFKRVKAIQVPGAPIPPVARTDGELRQRAETRGARSIARVPSETVGRPAYDMCPTQLLSVVTTR